MASVFTYKLPPSWDSHLLCSELSVSRNLLSLPLAPWVSIVDRGSRFSSVCAVRMIKNELSHNAAQRLLKYLPEVRRKSSAFFSPLLSESLEVFPSVTLWERARSRLV